MDNRTTQVEVIVFKLVDSKPHFLLLKRIPERGGFWQPITGGVHENEELLEAAKRELFEETKIKKYLNIIEDIYYFEFQSEGFGQLKEFVFGFEVGFETDAEISDEHSEKKWLPLNEAIKIIKYPTNKTAFKKLNKIIELKNKLIR